MRLFDLCVAKKLSGGGGGGDGQVSPDPGSLKPIAAGVDSDGVYISDSAADDTPILYGRDTAGIYAKEANA